MGGDKRFPRSFAMGVAEEIVGSLRPSCLRIEVAGSLRRGKASVGDVEIVYVPISVSRPAGGDLFSREVAYLPDDRISEMEASGVLARRLNKAGRQTFGDKNKLMLHVPSGIPVDLFSTTEEAWWNYLVCRTGPAELNQRIASAALGRGWRWNPYGAGFTDGDGRVYPVSRERDVFELVGLPYAEPKDRL